MAVAVKTNPDARPRATPSSPAVLSLLGVVYVVACLALLFKVFPDLWWTAWNGVNVGSLQLARYPVIGASLLLIVSLLLAFVLLQLGGTLLGPQPPAGVRAGIFVGFVGLLLIVLLTRWVSIGIERLAYDGAIQPLSGAILTGVVGGLLLLGFLRLFTQKNTQKTVTQVEEMGWFSTKSYKASQGQRVRRATIFGILLLVGAGIYTMLHHNTLRRGGNDLTLNIPFTGGVAIEGMGDARDEIAKVAADKKTGVQIRYAGAPELRLSTGQVLSFDAYRQKVDAAVENAYKDYHDKAGESVVKAFKARVADVTDPVEYVMKVNGFIEEQLEELITREDDHGVALLKPDVVRRLRVIDNETEHANLHRYIEAVRREYEAANKVTSADDKEPVFNVPAGVALIDRFAMKDVYRATAKDRYVRVITPGDSKKFKEGQVVSKNEFDDEVAELTNEKSKALGYLPPEGAELRQPYGPTVYAGITLLPSLQYTVPLLLILGSIWVAWRAVNVPAFADFLIATEGELNKVSWTTQRKLVQDTVVVLVTVFLMAVFLLVVDYGWKMLLQPLGVLHIPKVSAEQQKQIEQKKW